MVDVPGAVKNGLTLHPWTCRHCGASFGTGVPNSEVDAHVGVCEKHPMRALEAEIERLRSMTAPLSFRDQCVLALLKNPSVARISLAQGDEKEIFDFADAMEAERQKRSEQ